MIFTIRSPENNEDQKMFLIEGVIDWLTYIFSVDFFLLNYYIDLNVYK